MVRALAGLVFLSVVSAAAASPAPRVTARIATGLHPGGAVAAFGSVWVANDGSGTLARVDPRTNRVIRRLRVGRGAFSVTAGAGAVWVTNYRSGAVIRVDPRRLRIRRIRIGGAPSEVLVAFGRVWVTRWESQTLVELSPRTSRVLRRIRVGRNGAGLTAAQGAVWVGFGGHGTSIARVNPKTAAVERIPVGTPRPALFARGTKDFWIQANDNVLVHVDPASRRVLGRLRIGRTLAQGAAGPDGMLWVPDKEQNVVFRIDAATGRVVDSFPAGRGAYAALRAFGSMWVTSYAGSDVWRFRPGR
jgi:streptogramin lyase